MGADEMGTVDLMELMKGQDEVDKVDEVIGNAWAAWGQSAAWGDQEIGAPEGELG